MPEMLSARRQRSEISLQAVYELVVGETVGVFTYLSHCEAENMMLKRVTPLRDEYAAHPATRLYLGEPWERSSTVMRPACTAPRVRGCQGHVHH